MLAVIIPQTYIQNRRQNAFYPTTFGRTVRLEMAGLHRLSAIACQEMTEAVIASNELGMVILDAVSDGKIDAQEIRAIWQKKLELDRGMGEAMLAAEECDNVEAHFEFANKRGLYATPHQYLREKDASLERLRAQYGTAHNKKRTAITALGRVTR